MTDGFDFDIDEPTVSRSGPRATDDGGGPTRRSFLGAAAATGGAVTLPLSQLGIDPAAASVTQAGSAEVTFTNQPTDGDDVVVDEVSLSHDGFVAIHDARLFEGKVIESVIGVTDSLGAGSYEDVRARLFHVKGGDFDREELERTQPLVAMPHRDTNGNEEYDFVATGGDHDGPFVRAGGAVVDLAFARVTPGVEFRNQETDGTGVRVAAATLPEGGFVAIHDASLFQGEVLDSVIGVSDALDPGRHHDIHVDLFEGVPGGDFDRDELEDGEPLVAMPHLDTNDNGHYDFVRSQGNQDGPYTTDGSAVVDLGFVAVED
ncbi:DUF7282 domain-containing protein [Halobaculum sp. EA56]|uniref:DUF7282 domain-containing protein n=1 Tax=Halobaculum sp. EA56 TaxID=3421648 RepID=UPI003EB6B2D1